MSLMDRFQAKFKVADSGCWEWVASKLPSGYGTISAGGKVRRDHRVSYELYVCPIPDGLQVCHRCDNPSCVNPEHLFLGTHQDNMDDRTQKNRHVTFHGEEHGNVKLSNQQIIDIRADSRELLEIAKQYGVTKQLIWKIQNRKAWAHIEGGETIKRSKKYGETNKSAKITSEVVIAIRGDTRTNKAIADDYGISFQQVSKIKLRQRWAHI